MERIGHYRIIEEMGRGGMGVVYKGYEESLSRFVAIKVLGEHLTRDPQFVKRFHREAQAAARISHPHIVSIYYVGEDAGHHYFSMEYLPGGNLESKLRQSGRVEPARAARWMLETARGLAAAHAEGLIHRDVKPANLLLDREGHVKIADFGLALVTTQATRLTGTGLFLGSPGYLSPEQCHGEELDGRTDIYSLGVTFYELLAGQIPFAGDSPAALVLNIVQSEPPPIEALNPSVDPALRAILRRMMVKERDGRYASARELAADLEGYLQSASATAVAVAADGPTLLRQDEGLEKTVVEAGPTRRLEDPAVAAAGRVDSSSAGQGKGRASRIVPMAALILVGLLLLVGGGGWALWSWLRPSLDGGTEEATSPGLLSSLLAARGETAPARDTPPAEVAQETQELQPSRDDAAGTLPGEAEQNAERSADTSALSAAATSAEEPVAPLAAPDPRAESPVVEPPRSSPPRSAVPQAAPAASPGSVAVVALGEPLLAGHVEAYLEERLQAHGVPLVDEKGTAEGMSLFQAGSDPPLEALIQTLRPRAGRLILAQVDFVGDRPLSYLGRSETAYRSRVSIRGLDLATGEPVGIAVDEEVEYTALSAERAVQDGLSSAVRQFVGAL